MENDVVTVTPAAASRFRWDVFLSFRGEDTRHTITQKLYDSLLNNGVRVFLDDEGLNRGDEIDSSLIEAIEDSAASIVILSPDYATSHWCLDELARICELQRLILPVFFRVDPSHVRKQIGPFEEGFKSHEAATVRFGEVEVKRFGEDKVKKWRNAMAKVGGIAGNLIHGDNNSDEDKLINSVVKRVLAELSNTPLNVAEYTVGLDSRLKYLINLLDVKSNSVHVLGLHGLGGVGKTTLAKALYNKLVGFFPFRSFISNVRDVFAEPDGLVTLQKKFVGNIDPSMVKNINGVNSFAIKETLLDRRVLIVLDDVDSFSQLNAIAGKREWFCEGSRIIITTRNTKVLPQELVDQHYEVRELDTSEALQLFSYCALRREKPTGKFLDLSKEIVSLTGGLPLALEVFGSFLYDKRKKEQWEEGLKKLRQIRPKEIQDVLKISFDTLDDQNQCAFLDIACLFVKMNMGRDEAIEILDGCGFSGAGAIQDLIAKSLIKIVNGTLWMHDQIRDMGRQIVQKENFGDPGMRSRLWERDEIISVLNNHKGTRYIQGMILDYKKRLVEDPAKGGHKTKGEVVLHTKGFEHMTGLRLLQINCVDLVHLEGKSKFLSAELKWLQWKHCPMKSLPPDYSPRELAVLDLSESGIENIWGSNTCKVEVAKNLMVMNLYGCYNLAGIHDLSEHHALKKIVLERCHKLVKLHDSIGGIGTLLQLNLRDCRNLVQFPINVSGLKNLQSLILSSCAKLEELPEDIGSMRHLKELLVDGTAIASLPRSIFRLTELETLNLSSCKFLKQLPSCIDKLVSLKQLYLNSLILEELPDSIGSLINLEILSVMHCAYLTAIPHPAGNLVSLTKLFIHGSAITQLPPSIGSLSSLKKLSAGNCSNLTTLPGSIEGLASLVDLQLGGESICHLPNQIGALKMLKNLVMLNCTSLITLPESTGSLSLLTTLNISNAGITELPESIGMLESLIELRLNKCSRLQKLPDSIGNLKSLYRLYMDETAVTELPESFGMLSSLMVLRMLKKPPSTENKNLPESFSVMVLRMLKKSLFRIPKNSALGNSATLNAKTEKPTKVLVFKESFSNLSSLEELNARSWNMCGQIHDDFKKLTSLETLDLGNNKFCSLPSSLSGLSLLKKLLLPDCRELRSLPPLPSSLEEVNLANCFALETVSDLSNLESLRDLNLTNCEKVVDIPGLECLKSLRRLYLGCCKTSSLAVKRRLSKIALKNLYNLSMPGTRIPDWFSQGKVQILVPVYRKIKEVIIGVVVSLDHEKSDNLRYHDIPAVVDIQAKIFTDDKAVVTTTLHLFGVPKNNEAQVHFCRYSAFSPLVLRLKDGDKIEVNLRNPPYVKGTQLKKAGIHVIYENDDDYDADEESVDEDYQSVSERLRKFFNSLEEDGNDMPPQVVGTPKQRVRHENILHFLIVVCFVSCCLRCMYIVNGGICRAT